MKKKIVILLLASFIFSNIAPVSCFAIGKSSSKEPKKISISKTHKQRAKSDEFKYEYINYDWWKNFNDDILNGYIDKAIKNNYDLKMATIAVDAVSYTHLRGHETKANLVWVFQFLLL